MATQTFGGGGAVQWGQEVNKSTDYTVLNTDSGTLFTASGAANFTLPSLANGVGCSWWFLQLSDNNMVITAPSGKLIQDGNAASTTATFSTSSHKIGSFVYVAMNAAGTFYYIANLGKTAVTVG